MLKDIGAFMPFSAGHHNIKSACLLTHHYDVPDKLTE
jgi:hypothetical protein